MTEDIFFAQVAIATCYHQSQASIKRLTLREKRKSDVRKKGLLN